MKLRTNTRIFTFLLIVLAMIVMSELIAQPGQGQGRIPEGASIPLIGKLTGTIVDGQTKEPLMFASVVLNRQMDSTMVSGAITDEKGRFVMEQLPPGNFFITVNFIGYDRQNFNSIRITFREPEFSMGVIEVQPAAQTLTEVTVEAQRSLMETGLDRRVINVGQELTSIGGTGLDIMQNIPSVAVDFDGNISLRGNSNVTILIDGRPSTLTGLSGSEALQQLPAEMIERVEVITNPSARYNPEGTSGIINVVLKKQRAPGYNGMVSLNAGTAGTYSGSINFNYRYNKFNLFTNYSGRLSDSESFGWSQRQTFSGNDVNVMDQSLVDGTWGRNSHNAQVGVDYNFNSKNVLTLSSRFSNWDMSNNDISEYRLYQDFLNPNSLFVLGNRSGMEHNSFTHQLNFRRTYEQRVRELNVDFSFSTRDMDRQERLHQQYFENDFNTPKGSQLRERSNMDGSNWAVSSQLDYVHPLSENSKFETGYMLQSRNMDSDFNFENELAPDFWVNNPNRSNRFLYNEQVLAAYGMYATMLGKFSLQAGVRAEQTFTEADQRNDDNDVFRNNYLNFFPTMHLRRNMENNQAVQLSYSRRINRPDNRRINPFVRYNSEYDVSYGNPYLNPEFIDSYEIGYTRFWKATTLNPSIFYRNTQGMISWYRFIENIDGRDVTVNTFENLDSSISYGAELILSQRITSWWNMNGTFSYFRTIIDGAQMEREADSYSWSGRFVSNINIRNGWNIQVNGFYRSPVIMLQGEMAAMYSVNAGLRKNVWGNAGSISLNVSDIFNTQRFSMFNYGENFNMNMERWRTSRIVTLGFTYRINEFERRNNRRLRDTENGRDNMDFDNFGF